MSVEFWQFIEKQYAVMSQGNLSRPGVGTSADEGHGRGRVMRTPKRPRAPLARLQRAAGNRAQRRHIHRLRIVQRRNYARQSLREHALPRPGRSYEQQTVL